MMKLMSRNLKKYDDFSSITDRLTDQVSYILVAKRAPCHIKITVINLKQQPRKLQFPNSFTDGQSEL